MTSKPVYKKIVLRFPKEVAYRVYDEFDITQVEIQANGDLIVSTEMPEDAWLIGYLLTFGTQVDIIEPLYLKEVLAEQARKIYPDSTGYDQNQIEYENAAPCSCVQREAAKAQGTAGRIQAGMRTMLQQKVFGVYLRR